MWVQSENNLPAVLVLVHTQCIGCGSQSFLRLEVCEVSIPPVTACGEESLKNLFGLKAILFWPGIFLISEDNFSLDVLS